MTTDVTKRKELPKQAFDCEYMTEWRREVDFLADCGIYPSYKKYTRDYAVPMYKYTKTPQLFTCLAHFYEQVKRQREYDILSQHLEEAEHLPVDDAAMNVVQRFIAMPGA